MRLRSVLIIAAFMGLLSVAPYIAHTFYPQYQGLTVQRDKDYANYEARLERALKGHPEEAANAITPVGSEVEGIQTAGMEIIVASLFGWTGLDAPTLAVIVTGIFTAILFALFVFFLELLEFPRKWSLGISLILFAAMFHGLSRVMHPGWSFVPTFLSLICFFHFWKDRRLHYFIPAIFLLGLLPYLYFWSWTWVWASAGVFVLLSLITDHWKLSKRNWWLLIILAIGTAILTIPFFVQTHELMKSSLYPEIAVRASFLYQRTPESWIRSILLVIDSLVILSLFSRKKKEFSYLAAASLVIGITIAMHQNVLHNRVLMFASHYEPHIIISTVIAAAWAMRSKGAFKRRVIIVLIGALFLAGGFYDYGFAHRFFIPQPKDFQDQHLAPAISYLKEAGQQTVLTDADTGRVVTSWTDDGIVYTTHARFLLISDKELAERFCVSEIANPNPLPARVLTLEYNAVLQSPEYQKYESDLLSEACTRVKKDPVSYLKKYGVAMVLWNAQQRPTWKVDARRLGLSEVESGSGWTLWKIQN